MKRLTHLGMVCLLLALPACAGLSVDLRDGGPASRPPDASADSGAGIGEGERCAQPGADERACCVGNAACCEPTGEPLSLTLAACPDGALDDCAVDPRFVAFGSAPPRVREQRLVPGEGVRFGGVALGEAVDPRAANLRVAGTVESPAASCGGECIDVAGLALLDAVPAGGEPASIRLGVLVNAGLQRVQMVVANEVVQTADLAPGAQEYSVSLGIDGHAEVRIGAADEPPYFQASLALPGRLVPAVLGRIADLGSADDAVAVRDAQVRSFACDAPSALDPRPTPALEPASPPGRPSVFSAGGAPRALLFARDGALEAAPIDPGAAVAEPALGAPAVLVAPRANERLSDPVALEVAGEVQLYAVRAVDGEVALVRGVGEDLERAAERLAAAEPSEVLTPADLGADAIAAPSVFTHQGGLRMILTVTEPGRAAALWQLASADAGASWELPAEGGAAEVHRASGVLHAFDRDGVSDAAVVFHGGLYRVYFAGRRGTRWSVGLLVSADLAEFYPVGVVLGPDEAGHDALTVRGPAPLLPAAPSDLVPLPLYYLASDGVRSSLGYAGRHDP